MDNAPLIHDVAIAMARSLLDRVAGCLRDEERIEALHEFYHVCKTGIEAYVMQRNREIARLNPSRN